MEKYSGLFVVGSDKPVPLIAIHFDVNVKGFAGSVTINQTYRNVENTDLECVYGFPMNDQAAVIGFTVKIDDRVLTSQFKKKDEAFKEYNEALQRGDGAYLLDQADRSDDTFILSVGRLPPGKECVVSITYVCTLESVTETKQRLVIPMALVPRYSPNSDSATGQAAPPEKYASNVPYKTTLDARIETLDQVKSVLSVLHPIAVNIIGPNSVQVTFGAHEQPLDRDLVVDIEINNNPQHHVVIEHVDGDQYVGMYAFVPTFEKGEESVHSELVFIVDCSGSMQGDKIEDAKRAMQIFLRSIPEGCYFNFYRFGSTFESLFPESKLYSQDTFKAAKEYADATFANLGGTEILQPLTKIFSTAPLSGFSRQLFVLTDGEVNNTEAVIELVKKNASSSRVFSFGIGDSCSRSLVNGIALAGNGKSEYCKHGEVLEDKIGRHLERALQPAVVQASVLWEGVKNVQQVPYVLPPVFRGDRQIAYAFFEIADTKQSISPKVVLQLKDKLTQQTSLIFPLNEKAESDKLISKLAARALIKYLETAPTEVSQSVFGGSLQVRKLETTEPPQDRKIPDKKDQITDISLKHGVMSKYVSLLAVEKREGGQAREMLLREVPVQVNSPMMHSMYNYNTNLMGTAGPRSFAAHTSATAFSFGSSRSNHASGLFGSPSSAFGPGSGSFGSAAPGHLGVFGSSAQAVASRSNSSGFGSVGQTTAQAASLFGSSTAAQAPSDFGSAAPLFGPGAGSFGSAGFGGPATAQTTGFFGSAIAPGVGSFGFRDQAHTLGGSSGSTAPRFPSAAGSFGSIFVPHAVGSFGSTGPSASAGSFAFGSSGTTAQFGEMARHTGLVAQDAASSTQKPVLNQLLDLQQWDGSWEFSADLERLLGVPKEATQQKCGEQLDATVLATLLVKAFLGIKHADQAQIWQAIAKKASNFIQKHISADKEADLVKTLQTLFLPSA